MRTSFAVLAISAVTAVSAQRKVYSAADINVANVNLQTRGMFAPKNTRGKSPGSIPVGAGLTDHN